jgi:hypothetical protein
MHNSAASELQRLRITCALAVFWPMMSRKLTPGMF